MGSIPFISKQDERIKAAEFPPNNNREDGVGDWREHPQLRTGNVHLAPGVNERIIAKSLREQP
jgi:hypothetical protein